MTAIERDLEEDRAARLRLADWELKGVKGRLKACDRAPSKLVMAILGGRKSYQKVPERQKEALPRCREQYEKMIQKRFCAAHKN